MSEISVIDLMQSESEDEVEYLKTLPPAIDLVSSSGESTTARPPHTISMPAVKTEEDAAQSLASSSTDLDRKMPARPTSSKNAVPAKSGFSNRTANRKSTPARMPSSSNSFNPQSSSSDDDSDDSLLPSILNNRKRSLNGNAASPRQSAVPKPQLPGGRAALNRAIRHAESIVTVIDLTGDSPSPRVRKSPARSLQSRPRQALSLVPKQGRSQRAMNKIESEKRRAHKSVPKPEPEFNRAPARKSAPKLPPKRGSENADADLLELKDSPAPQVTFETDDVAMHSSSDDEKLFLPPMKQTLKNSDLIDSDSDDDLFVKEDSSDSKTDVALRQNDSSPSFELVDEAPSQTQDRADSDKSEVDEDLIEILSFDKEVDDQMYATRRKEAEKFFETHPDRDSLTGIESYVERDDVEIDEQLEHLPKNYMVEVPQLSKSWVGEDGLPVKILALHGDKDDRLLYFFEIRAAKSGVPGAGNGAYITLLEVRELTWEARHRKFLSGPRDLYFIPTMDTLAFSMLTHGTGVLRLAGKGLHDNEGCLWWHPTAKDGRLVEVSEPRQGTRTIRLRVAGESIEPPPFARTTDTGIGLYRIFTEADYRPSYHTFAAKDYGFLRLGRYGPFQPSDKKSYHTFELKSWIFSKRPAEWGFDIEDDEVDDLCFIDITSDTTGDPHDLAQRHLPMHVNEVAHSPTLTQNVFIRTEEWRVEYFGYLGTDTIFHIGQSAELLTHYMDYYEPNRERKGYGKSNIYEGVPDDSHHATRLLRNFVERDDACTIFEENEKAHKIVYKGRRIERGRFLDLLRTFNDLFENIWIPLLSVYNQFSEATVDDAARTKHANTITAIIRCQWVFERIIGSLEIARDLYHRMETKFKNHPNRRKIIWNLPSDFVDNLVAVSKEKWDEAASITVPSLPARMGLLLESPCSTIHDNDPIRYGIRCEIVEEVLYDLKGRLLKPLDHSVWCPVAIQLMANLSLRLWRLDNDSDALSIILEETTRSKDFILKGKEDCYRFESGIPIGFEVATSHVEALDSLELNPSFFVGHTSASRGYLDQIIKESDHFAFRDSTLDSKGGGTSFVMTKRCFPLDNESTLVELASFPSSNDTDLPNKKWYLTWQVAYIADAFARVYVLEYSNGKHPNHKYLKQLAEAVGIDASYLLYASNTGMHNDKSQKFRRPEGDREPLGKIVPLEAKVGVEKHGTSPEECEADVFEESEMDDATGSVFSDHGVVDEISHRSSRPTEKIRKKSQTKKKPAKTTRRLKGGNGYPRAEEIWSGEPDEEFIAWPMGWLKKTFKRQSGKTKGSTDHYWYTPLGRHKLRSIREVTRFFKCLELERGERDERTKEENAWARFRGRKK